MAKDPKRERRVEVLSRIAGALRRGEPLEALREITRFIQPKETTCETLMLLATASAESGDLDCAKVCLYRALEHEIKDPQVARPCVDVVILDFIGAKRYGEALAIYEDCDKAGLIEPDMVGFKGRLLFMLGRYHEALVALRKALELEPADPLYWSTIAWIAEKTEDIDLAGEVMRNLQEIATTENEIVDKAALADAIEDVEGILSELRAMGTGRDIGD